LGPGGWKPGMCHRTEKEKKNGGGDKKKKVSQPIRDLNGTNGQQIPQLSEGSRFHRERGKDVPWEMLKTRGKTISLWGNNVNALEASVMSKNHFGEWRGFPKEGEKKLFEWLRGDRGKRGKGSCQGFFPRFLGRALNLQGKKPCRREGEMGNRDMARLTECQKQRKNDPACW